MAEDQKTSRSPHVLLLPFPGQGHINPMIEFGKRLLSKGVKTTLVTTVYILKSMTSENITSIDIEAISDGFDEGGYASADSAESYLDSFHKIGSKTLTDLVKKLQKNQETNVDAIIYDSIVPWAMDVAMALGIEAGVFFTQACAVNSVYYHVYKGIISVSPGDTVSVPGLPRLEYTETPSFVHIRGPYPGWSKLFLSEQFYGIDKARWVISNTFYKLEEKVIEWMKTIWPLKVIGPTLPSMYLDTRLQDDKDYGINLIKPNHIKYISWLNDKPKGSVVYISFGSIAELGPPQMEEIAWGLTDSGVNFMWVVRSNEEEKLPNGFLDKLTGKGLIVPWCNQLDVLAHESVGCFVTHCGFNSTLEAISLGVPIVGMPQWTDQITNAKCIEDIWGVGLRVKVDDKGVVTRGEILSCIREIMEGERGLVARKNAMKWRSYAKEAVDEGGSSDKDIDEFVSELKH